MLFSTFYSVLILITWFFLRVSKLKYQILVITAFIVVISITAMFLQPLPGHFYDTLRFDVLFDTTRAISNAGDPSDSWHWMKEYGYPGEPLVAGTLWLFSFVKFNGLLRGMTTALFLIFIFRLIVKTRNEYQLSGKALAGASFAVFFCFNMYFQIEGIRNFLAFSMLAWTIFNDVNLKLRNKKNMIWIMIGYLVSYLIHPSVLLFIALRLILLVKNKIIKYLAMIILILYQQLLSEIIPVLAKFKSISVINLIVSKSSSYMASGDNFQAFAGKKEIVITSFLLVIIIADLLFLFRRGIKKMSNDYFVYLIGTIAMCICSFNSTQIYLRTIILIFFLSLPYFLFYFDDPYMLKTKLQNERLFRIIKYLQVICFTAILVYWNLSTYVNVIVQI